MIKMVIFAILVCFYSLYLGAQEDVDLIDDTKQRSADAAFEKWPSQKQAEIQCMGKHLDAFYKDCGRYPTAKEGLRALVSKPKTVACKSWGRKTDKEVQPYIASLPKDALAWVYKPSKSGSSYSLKPLNGKSEKTGDGNRSAEDFLKTCAASEQK